MKILKSMFLSLIALMVVVGTSYAAINIPTKVGIVKREVGSAQSESVVVYKLVRYATFTGPAVPNGIAPSLVSGDAVVWDTVSDDGVTVRTTTSSADGAFAGIVYATILSSDNTNPASAADDAGRRNWGYIAVEGGPIFASMTAGGSNSPNVGDMVLTSTDAGKICGSASNNTVTATGAEANKLVKGYGGFFYNAPGASDTTAIIHLRRD